MARRVALIVPLTVAALAAPAQVIVGDWAGRTVAQNQPTKLAAFEGLPRTEKDAPIHILGLYTDNQIKYGIEIPRLLSLLAFHNPDHVVQGLDTVPANDGGHTITSAACGPLRGPSPGSEKRRGGYHPQIGLCAISNEGRAGRTAGAL